MVVQSLEPQKDSFRHKKPDEKILDYEVSYLNTIKVLMYLTQYTKSKIAFVVNLLTNFSFEPTMRH